MWIISRSQGHETSAAETGIAAQRCRMSFCCGQAAGFYFSGYEALPPESRSKLIDLAEIMKTANEKK